MAYVITSPCIDIKDGACVQCCPVDCIYEGERNDANVNALTVGVIAPNQRALAHVTLQFVDRIVRRLKHVELSLREV
ncbi:hypothetical protein BN2475_120071 [Paraburkholderia ribeironis]|uniref:Ferredoxin n=1 Tax=Paraburkholderia ribeironis TaxID=1247936 RepID=A0A1N7RQY3_9BURK|nr:hypothetical protein [Paraburkholderia ribeironis]SIT37514.1 hypothetical protein BN2475_120071 [Paraburkholderia ribeironis]